MKRDPSSIQLKLPGALTVAGWVRYHLDMVADLPPAELDRLAKQAHRAALEANAAAKASSTDARARVEDVNPR